MSTNPNEVIDKIKELYGFLKFEYKESTDSKTENVFFVSNLMRIRYRIKENVLDVSFNIGINPVTSSKITLHLTEQKIDSKINLCLSFFTSDDGTVYSGEPATKEYMKCMKEFFINEYNNEREIEDCLENMPVWGNC